MIKRVILLFIFYFILNSIYSQKKIIKVLTIQNIEFYYVYKAYDYCSKDTIVLLSSKADDEFKKFRLNIGKRYVVETRPKSAIKISKDEYVFCKPNVTTLENIKISDDGLPILILNFKELEKSKIKKCQNKNIRRE